MAFIGEVAAFEALGGKLRVNGFARNETGVRLQDHVWVDQLTDLGIKFGNIGAYPPVFAPVNPEALG
jgi:hypothetical protein